METMSRKERERLTHRAEILRAAEKVFALKGFFQTTMNEIARAAEFGTGTLYKFFKSKEDLYFTLIDEKTDEIYTKVQAELTREAPAIERIKNVLVFELEFMERNRDFFKIYTSEGGVSSGRSRTIAGRRSMRRWYTISVSWLRFSIRALRQESSNPFPQLIWPMPLKEWYIPLSLNG